MTDKMTQNDTNNLNTDEIKDQEQERMDQMKEELEILENSDLNRSLEMLVSSLSTMRSQMEFASLSFTGNVGKVENLISSTDKSLEKFLTEAKKLIAQYKRTTENLEKSCSVIALLPSKNQESLEKLVPDIGKEVEQIHGKRMKEISSTLTGLKDAIGEECKSHQESLKVLLSDFQKQLNDNIVSTIDVKLKEIADHTKKEVSAVTANHGTKFLRNLAISIILATSAGALSGWYINQYFPSFVRIGTDANVTINRSHVQVWKADINNEAELVKN